MGKAKYHEHNQPEEYSLPPHPPLPVRNAGMGNYYVTPRLPSFEKKFHDFLLWRMEVTAEKLSENEEE